MRKVIVTGSSGYIGSVLTPFMSAIYDTVGIDTDYYYDSFIYYPKPPLSFIHKDIRNVTIDDMKDVYAVIHLAGLSNDPLGDYVSKELTMDINCNATVKLASLAKEAGADRFLFSSSCSVYGVCEDFVDERSPTNPLTAYAESKIRAEESISALADDHFSPVILRNATVYGHSPMFRSDLVINNLMCWAMTTGRVKIMSDGTAWRPMVHVVNVAAAFAFCLEADKAIIHNQIFNIGSNEHNLQVNQLAAAVSEATGTSISYSDVTKKDARSYRVKFDKFASTFGEYAPLSLSVGLAHLNGVLNKGLTSEDFIAGKYSRLDTIKSLRSRNMLDESLLWRTT